MIIDLIITLGMIAVLCIASSLLYLIRPLRRLLDRVFPEVEEDELEEIRIIGFEREGKDDD